MDRKEKNNTYKILYENAVKSSNQQDERKNIIDNKVNILLTMTLVLLGIIIEFVQIDNIFRNTTDIAINIQGIIYRVLLFLLYVICLINCLIIIIRSLLILRGKKYRLINPQNFIAQEAMNISEDGLLKIFIKEYVENAKNNSEANKKQMEIYDSNIILMIIELILITILYIGLKVI